MVSFDGTSGWHRALQTFVDLSNSGCFQAGVTGTTGTAAIAQFAQGQALMAPGLAVNKGSIDASSPQFAFSFRPFPDGEPTETRSYIYLGDSLGINAHASAQDQTAAQTFIDFLARPKQNAIYAQTTGGLTQYQFLHLQIPSYMADFAPVFQQHKYVVSPIQSWWNANVVLALQQDTIGLITGQTTIDQVLQAMDAAWKQGAS
jgi:raffinose/stachyose/melibiose transport system substrate-binding protein